MPEEEPKVKLGSLCSRLSPKKWRGQRGSKFMLLLKFGRKKMSSSFWAYSTS